MKSALKIFVLAAIAISISSCKKDDIPPEIPNEEEVITTLVYTLTPVDSGNVVTLQFRDLDGDGGIAPVISTGILAANTTYQGKILLLNELETPADTISNEVNDEALEHQFFFSDSPDYTVAYDDFDSNGNPIGLKTLFTTNDAGVAVMTITLRHQPDKSAANVSAGDITNAGGETDISVTFEIEIE